MRHLHAIASVITVLTALANVAVATAGGTFGIPDPGVLIEIPNVLMKIVVFFYLELAISLFFAYAKLIMSALVFEVAKFYRVLLAPVAILLLFTSAWTSVFNIEWLFVDPSWGYSEFNSSESMKILALTAASAAIMWTAGGFAIGLFDKKPNDFDSVVGLYLALLLLFPMAAILAGKYFV